MSDALERPIGDLKLADGIELEDNWFACKRLDPGTLAIGEPAYHQCNWSYLISDGQESLLWDTGSGRRPIAPLVRRMATGRITAFPSHMHFDHLGGIHAFGPATLADLPTLRALEVDGTLTPPETMFLGRYENLDAPRIEVGQWAALGSTLTIGRRQLEVIHTPGHSPDSVSLWEAGRNRLYAADLIYPGELYAQVPGACLPVYAETLAMLLEALPTDVELACAHGCEDQGKFDVPLLRYGDLKDTLVAIKSLLGQSPHDGACRVNSRLQLLYSKESFTDQPAA